MRRIALTTLVALVVGLTVTVTASPAAACTCMFEGDEVSLGEYDAVFFGSILEIRADADTDVWLVEVDSILKGEPASLTTIETTTSTSACGIELASDQPAVFFVDDNFRLPSGEYVASLCSPTRILDADDVVLADLPRVEPAEADPSIRTAFDSGAVEAPDEVEVVDELPAEEAPVIDDEVEVVSERDQAELAAAAEQAAQDEAALAAGAGLDDGPGDTNRTGQVVVFGLVLGGLVGLGIVLRRRVD